MNGDTGRDGWLEAEPEAVGLSTERLQAADREVQRRLQSVESFLVVKRGCLAWERYYDGGGPRHCPHLFSVTKSVLSALVGIAIARGQIAGVEQPVLDFFPEASSAGPDSIKKRLTVRHFLTMTPGLQWITRAYGYEPLAERLRGSSNWIEFILSLPVKERLIGRFQYNSAASHLLSAVLTRATGRPARELANEELFAPLGIGPVADAESDDVGGEACCWAHDPQGYTIGGWGLALSARDVAKFGRLYLDLGRWGDRQVVPKQWVLDSVTPHTREYGYHWWLRTIQGVRVYAAVGRGGQHVFCLPEKEMVVVLLSRPSGRWVDRWPVLEEFFVA